MNVDGIRNFLECASVFGCTDRLIRQHKAHVLVLTFSSLQGFAVGGATHAIAGYMAGEHVGWQDPTGAIPLSCLQQMGVVLEDGMFESLLAIGVLEEDWRRGHMDVGKEALVRGMASGGLDLGGRQ